MTLRHHGTFAALELPAYRLLWLVTFFQFLGIMTLFVVRGFLAFELTDSNAALGGLFLAFGVSMFVSMFWAGVYADRVSKRRLLTTMQLFYALQIVVLAVLVLADLIEYWMLFVQALIEGATLAFLGPVRQAIVGDMLDASDVGNGVALQQAALAVARIIGPAAGGALVATTLGVGWVFMLVALMLAIGAALSWFLPEGAQAAGPAPSSLLSDLIEGVRYVRSRRALFVMVLMSYVLALTAFPYFVFLPAVVKDVFDRGPLELGIINAAAAVGAVIAAVWVAGIVSRPRVWEIYIGASISFGLLVIVFGLAPTFLAALAAIAVLGAAEQSVFSLNMSLGMAYSHRAYDGRVQSLIFSSFCIFGIVSLPLGLLADWIGVREMLVLEGSAATVLVLALLAYARRVDARADALAPAALPPRP